MKVYILWFCKMYIGDYICSVFSSLEKAEAAKELITLEEDDESFRIEEIELDNTGFKKSYFYISNSAKEL